MGFPIIRRYKLIFLLALVFSFSMDQAYCASLSTLSPRISLENLDLRSIFKQAKETKPMEARFLMHSRTAELLQHIAEMIKDQEKINIYAKVISDDGSVVIDFEKPLRQITGGAPAIDSFLKLAKFNAETPFINIPHSYYLSFLDAQGNSVRPMHLVRFFSDFFAKKLKREDGSFIDVCFWENDFDTQTILSESDYRRIIDVLGYASSADKLLELCDVYTKKKKTVKPNKKNDYFMTRQYLEMVRAHTPDYKGHEELPLEEALSLNKKTDNTEKLVLSAI